MTWDGYFAGAAGPGQQPAGKPAADPWGDYFGQPAAAQAPIPTTTAAAPAAPSSPNSLSRIPLMLGGKALEGLAKNVDLVGAMTRELGDPRLTSGAKEPLVPGEVAKPGAAQPAGNTSAIDLLHSLGLVPPPAQTPGERLAGAAASGLGGALPFLATGGGALPLLAAGAASGAAGEGADMLQPGSPGVGAAAGVLTGGLIGAMTPATTLTRLARGFGTSETLQQAGTAVQSAARDWVAAMPGRVDAIWNPVNAAIPPTTAVPLTNYTTMLQDLTSAGGRYSASARALSSDLPRRLLTDVQQTGPGAIWQEASDLRSMLGKLKANPSLAPGADQAQIDAMYSGLTGDMEAAAQGVGQGDAFRAANQQTHALYDLRRGLMNKLVKGDTPEANDPRPGDVAGALLSGGKRQGTDLALLRQELPQATDELVAGHLSLPGGGVVWNSLSPEAKAALVPDAAQRAVIDQAIPARAGSSASHSLQALTAGAFTRALGGLTSTAFSGMHPVVGESAGEALGIMLPSLARGMKRAVATPEKMLLPVVGGVEGAER